MDADLQLIRAHADLVSQVGVQRLVDALQWYRDGVRVAFRTVTDLHGLAHETTSLYRLRDTVDGCNRAVGELNFRLELDHIDIADLLD